MRDVNMSPIRSIERAFAVLQAFTVEKPMLTLDELSLHTRLPRSTVYRILCTLEGIGVVKFDQNSSRYKLGLRLFDFMGLLTSAIDVTQEAEEILNNLNKSTSQTVCMAVKDETEIVCVYGKENNFGLKYSSFMGERRPYLYGVLGPILLAFEPEDQIERILNIPIPQSTPYTVTDKDQIRQRLQKIKKEYIFVESDETSIGVTGIGAPIFNAKEEVIAAIGVIGPTAQLMNDELTRIKHLTFEAAEKISMQMGYQGKAFKSLY